MYHSILSHYPAETVDRMMAFLERLAPEVGFHVAYGGPEAEFHRIRFPRKDFLADPKLRGPIDRQNFHGWFKTVSDGLDRTGSHETEVYFSETDQLILRPGYAAELSAGLARSGGDFLGKWCFDTTGTNEFFSLRHRHDPVLQEALGRLARSPAANRAIWTTLGSGMLFRRPALRALAAEPLDLPVFTEIMIPSALHHLGFTLGDFDDYGSVCEHLRYRPGFETDQVLDLIRQGAYLCHPFKEVNRLDEIYAAVLARWGGEAGRLRSTPESQPA